MTVPEETDIIVNAVDFCNAKKKNDRLKKKRRHQDQTKTKHAPKPTSVQSNQGNPPDYEEIIMKLCRGIETLNITDSDVGVPRSNQGNPPNYEEIIKKLCRGIETLNITDSDVGVRPGTSGC
jgi:hypothetical protein